MGGGGDEHEEKRGGSRGRWTGAGAVSRGLSIRVGRPAGAQRGETCCRMNETTWGRSTWIRRGRGWWSSAWVGVVVHSVRTQETNVLTIPFKTSGGYLRNSI